MKKTVFLLSLLAICVQFYGQGSYSKYFQYPIKQSTKEWQEIKTPAKRVAALQIPETKIKTIPTSDLLDICLDYPCLIDIFLYDNYQKGMDAITTDFNGFKELSIRRDLAKILLDRKELESSRIMTFEPSDSLAIGHYSIQRFVADLLLSQSEVFVQLQIEDLHKLDSILMKKSEFNAHNKVYFGAMHHKVDELLCQMTKQSIHTDSASYKMSEVRLSGDYIPVTINTPNGSSLPDAGKFVGNDIVPGSYEYYYIINYITATYPGTTIISPPTKKYNCHGYAWNMTEGGDTAWINSPIDLYWTDGSYVEVDEAHASKIVYSGDHSAIKWDNVYYQSKWGELALVRHTPDNVPSGYLPFSTKRYFLRLYISGPTIPSTPSTYTVENLPSDWTVTWSMQNRPVLPSYVTTNSPGMYQLQIDNSAKAHIKETLVAKVYNSMGTLITTLTKYIDTAHNFSATYSQTTIPNNEIISGTIYDSGTIQGKQGTPISITSQDFTSATITLSSTLPVFANPLTLNEITTLDPTYTHVGNTLQVYFYNSTGTQMSFVNCINGDKVINFRIRTTSPYIGGALLKLLLEQGNGRILNVSLVNVIRDSQDAIVEKKSDDEWDMTIYDAQTNMAVYSKHVTSGTIDIDASQWKPNTYIIHAHKGEQSISRKFVLK